MSKPLELKALYYPYARCSNSNTLKRAILIFDEIGFVDPTNPEMREGLIANDWHMPENVTEDWKIIRDDLGFLLERGIAKLYDPEQLIRQHDKLLGAALKADLDDDNIWRICTVQGTPETWSILRRKVPESAFEFLNSQTSARINYGTARAKAFFHREFMEWPNLKGEFEPKSNSSPFDPSELGTDMEGWLRYLFHDGKIACEMGSAYIKSEAARQEYLRHIEFSCDFPFTHGSSLAVNTALLLADSEGLVPFTDSKPHHEMLLAKFRRITSLLSSNKTRLSGISRLHPEKVRRVALTLLDVMVPDEIISNMSITQCVKYRDASREAFQRLKILVGDLASQIESEPVTEEFEREVQKVIYQKVFPEAQKAKDKAAAVYEKLFGKLAKRAIAALTPTLGLSVFAGLSAPTMLIVASAAALGSTLPDLLDSAIDERDAHRNSLSYLLDIK